MTSTDILIRGVLNQGHVNDAGTHVLDHTFKFDPPEVARGDDYLEMSINWDDEGARKFTLNLESNRGGVLYQKGFATITCERIQDLQKVDRIGDSLGYERNPLPDNIFHGNILLSDKVDKPEKKRIMAVLSMYAQYFPRVD